MNRRAFYCQAAGLEIECSTVGRVRRVVPYPSSRVHVDLYSYLKGRKYG